MKTMMLALMSSLILSSCNAQAVKEDKKVLAEKDNKNLSSTSGLPDVHVKVNKEYDPKGNVIRYDSTYTYFYSSSGNKRHINGDSLLKPYTNMFSLPKSGLFFNDSLFKYDLFNDRYLKDHFEMNRSLFDRMFHHLDSLKNNYREEYPPALEPHRKRI